MVSRHAALIAFLFALAASVLPSPRTATHVACARPCVLHTLSARSPGNLRCAVGGEQAVLARATGDGQQMADWLGTECGVLNAQQLLQVVALFTADENGVLTRGGLASLTEEDVADMLSPLPRLSRRVVASAAASLRKSHADAMANANEKEKGMAKAHVHSLRTTGSRRILADVTGASLPRWGADPSVAACALDATWGDLVRGRADGTGATFEAGGLGGLTEDPNFGVWLCQDGHACANGTSSFFCFVYDEVAKRFVAWGPNSQLHLVRDCGAGYFFDATCVNSPTNYVYPSTYTTRTLAAVAGYDAGTPSFSTVDISGTISIDQKYTGAVLLPSGKVVFVPSSAEKVGVFDPVTDTLSLVGAAISGLYKYAGGVLLPSGKVAFVPGNADKVGIFDPATETFTAVGATISGGGGYVGGVLLPSGKVVFVPYRTENVGLFDPATDTFSLVGPTLPGGYTYRGGVLLPSGKVVFAPANADDVRVFDPATETFTAFDISTTISRDNKYVGGVLLPSGKVAFTPNQAGKVGLFDPATGTFSLVGNAISGEYVAGVLLPNGKVVFVPWGVGSVGMFDPATDTFSTVGAAISSQKYWGGVVLPSGKVIFVPRNADNVGVLDPGNSEPAYTVSGGVPDAWRPLLSPHFNKF